MKKPGRPLGLSLAIIISAILFSLLPIAQVIFVLSLQQQFQHIEFLESGGAIGGGISGIDSVHLLIPLIYGLIFLGIAFMTWRGKPASIRVIFMVAVVSITLLTLLLSLASLNTRPTLEQGLDSSGDFSETLLRARTGISLLVTLYVIWYVNRGPARAFFRGHYLQNPDERA
jgi:hypothetical protein